MKEGDYVQLYLKSGISSMEYYVVPNVFEFFRMYIFFATYYRRKSIFWEGIRKRLFGESLSVFSKVRI